MKNYLGEVYDKKGELICGIDTKLGWVEGDKVEPSENDGDKNFLYYGERPESTYMLYLLNRTALEELCRTENRKEVNGMHIHDCVNTEGSVICWPGALENVEEAKEILKMWSILIAMYSKNDSIEDLNPYIEKQYEVYNIQNDMKLLIEKIIGTEGLHFRVKETDI